MPDCYADLGFRTVSTNPCGEIPLCPYDSCRLIAINLYSYVKNPFTSEAYFDFDLFKEHVGKAQRLMDDIIDLEMEKIDAIIEKIKADPENEEVKATELNLWDKIKKKTLKGRRTGLGTTAEGDMIAALGLRYGTSEATVKSVEVHRALALAALPLRSGWPRSAELSRSMTLPANATTLTSAVCVRLARNWWLIWRPTVVAI